MRTQSSYGQAAAPVRQQKQSQPHPRKRAVRATAGRVSLLVLLVTAFTLAGAANAFAISRDAVLARAQTWVDSPVPYSQSKYFGGYRTDCSGYASMCWQTGTSWATSSFYHVTHRIAVATLMPGDAMLKAGYHIRIFYGWVDTAHTQYVAYEQTGPNTKSSIKSMSGDLGYGYIPTRYNGITDSPASKNALKNSSFDVWASDDAVWWEPTGGDWRTSVVARRKDVYRTARNSLQLFNLGADPHAFTELSQIAPVSAATTYTLSAWVRTAAAPASLELRLAYLDAAGHTVAETRTTGAAWGLNASAFKQMTSTAVTPPGAVKAVVTMRLAGGTTAGGAVGNSAVLDDISLSRPQATITIKTSATTTYIGKTPVLSGSVTPTSAIGRVIVVYVQKPGVSRWSYSSNRAVYALGGAAAWQYKYYFKPGMTKGIYNFRADVPALPGYLGSSSPILSVRLK